MDYDELKKQSLEEHKKRQMEEQALAETEARIDSAVRGLLSEEARTRLNNVRLVNKDLYLKAVQIILYLQKAGQLQGKVEEEQLKQLLDKVSQKREINIRRK